MKTPSPWLMFVVQHYEWILSMLLYPVLTAVMTVAFRKRTPEEWEAWALTKPFLALVIETMKATGLHPAGLLKAVFNFTQRRAGKVPATALRVASLPEPLRTALANPLMHAILAEAARLHAEKLAAPPSELLKALEGRPLPTAPTPVEPAPPATPPAATG